MTLALFATCNSLRIVACVPQILKAVTDRNGVSSISLATWFLFLVANLSSVAYALINRSELGLAACFAGNALCSAAILLITYCKRRSHGRRNHNCDRSLRPYARRVRKVAFERI